MQLNSTSFYSVYICLGLLMVLRKYRDRDYIWKVYSKFSRSYFFKCHSLVTKASINIFRNMWGEENLIFRLEGISKVYSAVHLSYRWGNWGLEGGRSLAWTMSHRTFVFKLNTLRLLPLIQAATVTSAINSISLCLSFFIWKNSDNNSSYLIWLLEGLNKSLHIKHLKECLS